MQKVPKKNSPGENKKMIDDGNPKPEPPEGKDSENLDGMAKAFIVGVAWSYAEALERTKRARNQQKPAPESQPESEAESETETVDRTFENN
ncbi:hypothetical protein [Microcoleus sp. herbarium7]|uniref:hypothetical protein n=1 Tax=Microcoleus sp. herbarium7 TaxID=3055435 RepID=UPI002FD04A71